MFYDIDYSSSGYFFGMKQVITSVCTLFLLVTGLLAVMPSPVMAQYRGGGQYYAKEDTVAYRYDQSRRQKKIAEGSLIYVGSINGDWGMIRDNGNKMWTIEMKYFETVAAHKRRLAAKKAVQVPQPKPVEKVPEKVAPKAPKAPEAAKPSKPAKPAKQAEISPEKEKLQRLEDAASAREDARRQLDAEQEKMLQQKSEN